MKTKRYSGHFPGHLRGRFEEAVEAFRLSNDDEPMPEVDSEPILEIFGKLWNCSDILPSGVVSDLEYCDIEIKSRTYGSAARALREATREALRRLKLVPERDEIHELVGYDS
jgi:hypothetical protein